MVDAHIGEKVYKLIQGVHGRNFVPANIQHNAPDGQAWMVRNSGKWKLAVSLVQKLAYYPAAVKDAGGIIGP